MKMEKINTNLPDMICMRITRNCNARCDFCLAPPQGINPSLEELKYRINYLLNLGIKTIHFCGGEPTLHIGLRELLIYTHSMGGKCKLTTNGICIPLDLPKILFHTKTEIKVSVHGNKELHNQLTGTDSYEKVIENLQYLVNSGVGVSIQTTLIRGGELIVDEMAKFCIKERIRRLSFIPFLTRGKGKMHHETFSFLKGEKRAIREHIKRVRRLYSGRVDIRWLDFSLVPFYVVDTDGSLIIEHGTEEMDEKLFTIKIEN